MVRSFLGRFVRIWTKPRIDTDKEVQRSENALLHTGKGSQMIPPAAPLSEDRQGQPLKAFQPKVSTQARAPDHRDPTALTLGFLHALLAR
jgi:hypothetical protein